MIGRIAKMGAKMHIKWFFKLFLALNSVPASSILFIYAEFRCHGKWGTGSNWKDDCSHIRRHIYWIVLMLWSSRLLFQIVCIDFNLFRRQVRCYLFCFLNEIRAIKFVKCPKALHVPASITTCEDIQTAWNSRSPWTLRSRSLQRSEEKDLHVM